MKASLALLAALVLLFPGYYSASGETPTFLILDSVSSLIGPGEEVVIFTGYLVTADDEPIPAASISIIAFDQSDNQILLATGVTDANGEFEAIWISEYLDVSIEVLAHFPGDLDLGEAVSQSYTIEMVQEGGEVGEVEEEEPIIPFPEAEILMSTSRESYAVGDTVAVAAHLSEVLEGEEVYIAIFNGHGWLYAEEFVMPDPDGDFSFEFGVGGEYAVPGVWSIEALYLESWGIVDFEVTWEEPVEPESQTVGAELDGEEFGLQVSLTNGTVEQVTVDLELATLVIEIQSQFYDGEMVITIPRDLLDARFGDQDDEFLVFVNGVEEYYEEIKSTDTDRTLAIYVPGDSRDIEIIGISAGTAMLEETESVLTLEPPPGEVATGEIVTFGGSLLTVEGEALADALVWVLNDDAVAIDDTLAYGLTDSNGKFAVKWRAYPTDADDTVNVYVYFEGGPDFEGRWITESASEGYEITITGRMVSIEPEVEGAYMGLIGVWSKDPLTVAIINRDKTIPTEYEQDTEFAFKEWSRILKEASGNKQVWNFDIVRDTKTNIFKRFSPDILVEVKLVDEEVDCFEALGYAVPDPQLNLVTSRFEGTIPSVVFAGCEGEFHPHGIVRATALHELAHTFGLGHAFNKDRDLMCSTEDGIPTCDIFPEDDFAALSDLNINAAIFLYGKDGFAEPNIDPMPLYYEPGADIGKGRLIYLNLSTDKSSYAEGEAAEVTVEIFDSSGKPVDIEPTLSDIPVKPTRLGAGKYSFTIQNLSTGSNEFTVKAGESAARLSISVGAEVEVPEQDISVVTKPKKKVTLVSVKNSGDEPIYALELKISDDGKIRFVKARGWDRDRVDQGTVVVSSIDRPIATGKRMIILLITDNPAASIEWSAIGESGSEISKGVAKRK